MSRMVRTTVVLPTPGPPVMTVTLPLMAVATAERWDSERVMPVRDSAQGMARSGSMVPQTGGPESSRRSPAAMPSSARCKGVRKTAGRPSMGSSTRFSRASSARIACSTIAAGISNSATAFSARSSR